MKVYCPICKTEYQTSPEYIGRTMNCKKCYEEFTIQNPNLTPCPDCFSLISKRATICPHCGAPLSSSAGNTHATRDDYSSEREISVLHPGFMNSFWTILTGTGITLTGITVAPSGAFAVPVILVGLITLLSVWIELHFTTYRITTLRIIIRRGWISKKQDEIWIKDMRSVNLLQGVWQRIVGIGDVHIGTAATAGTEIIISGISNPQQVVDEINSLRH